MRFRRLGRSGLRVSVVGFGTMTVGGTLTDKAAFPLMDQAFGGGINLFDISEMADGLQHNVRRDYGVSESAVGRWLKTRQRDSVLIATKVCGPNDAFVLGRTDAVPHIRGGNTALDRLHIVRAAEGSLKRLGTDYLDLYQLHWPDRIVPMAEQLEALDRLIVAGKIRYAGISNETPWGLTRFITSAEAYELPRMVSVQNHYNLLHREFENGLQEVCIREDVGLLAFSPLAMGVLSGKYGSGRLPAASRLAKFPRYQSRWGRPEQLASAAAFAKAARKSGFDPAELALAWVRDRAGVASVLSSCTSSHQVDALIASAELAPDSDTLRAIEAAVNTAQ
ncbi:MAG: aldo/keto reductase [Proteobacteria bacterium]|nr:aldo/keto reductase [Pseudomonadota bacterium]